MHGKTRYRRYPTDFLFRSSSVQFPLLQHNIHRRYIEHLCLYVSLLEPGFRREVLPFVWHLRHGWSPEFWKASHSIRFSKHLSWCSVKISDTDFVEFPFIKSVSCSSMLPFWQRNVLCNTFSHIQTENDIRNNCGFSWCCNMYQCIRIRVDMHDCNCESQICSAILF